ncbi:hypothetical protein HYH03_011077 [Edaphochlamys debaryana]|uniref:Kinesin-like protein n=1 Tax=Edaphochlamys debaryana TaxID=47281 RepID=A0A835XUN0_9CHLO|nr:hypothetical protein HYH03_011077 [Edaphochlamys debaryana]|eukprot:KAG2490441.1 hypothetical protein HYH03_011077 [Edaphochlamys debaryana]
MAYGQTSNGKTHTMRGTSQDPGLMCMITTEVLELIAEEEDAAERSYLVRVKYCEIYNEEVYDLLATKGQQHALKGDAVRRVGQTDMNTNSSRSHSIFTMVVESHERGAPSAGSRETPDSGGSRDSPVRIAMLNIVDLAGSEKSESGAQGQQQREAARINKSLLALSWVIDADTTSSAACHIPYRESKLTRLLQVTLGGNAMTSIICTINPEPGYLDESRNTVRFASRALRLSNNATPNEVLSNEALIKRYERTIGDLTDWLKQQGVGFTPGAMVELGNHVLQLEQAKKHIEEVLFEQLGCTREALAHAVEKQVSLEQAASTLSATLDAEKVEKAALVALMASTSAQNSALQAQLGECRHALTRERSAKAELEAQVRALEAERRRDAAHAAELERRTRAPLYGRKKEEMVAHAEAERDQYRKAATAAIEDAIKARRGLELLQGELASVSETCTSKIREAEGKALLAMLQKEALERALADERAARDLQAAADLDRQKEIVSLQAQILGLEAANAALQDALRQGASSELLRVADTSRKLKPKPSQLQMATPRSRLQTATPLAQLSRLQTTTPRTQVQTKAFIMDDDEWRALSTAAGDDVENTPPPPASMRRGLRPLLESYRG